MIEYKDQYLKFIKSRGVGSKDLVADSRKSYISYLNGVSKLLKKNITPEMVHAFSDVEEILELLKGRRAESTVKKYRTALNHYVEMVQQKGYGNPRPERVSK